jgi:alpha-galactosidase
MQRDADGSIGWNNETFSEGMPALVNYLNNNKQKVGLTLGGGSKTCFGFPGSLDHEYVDAG